VPTAEFPPHVRRQAWPHVLLTAAYAGAMLTLLAWHSRGDVAAFAADLFFVLMLPFFVFLTVIAAVLYFQHTHPNIPWFADGDPERPTYGQEQLTVRVLVPRWLGNTGHNGFEHPAHHVCPSIPCYRLHEAQQRLSQLIGPASVEVPFSWAAMKNIFRRCKLYDYANRRWLDFDGRPT
jgi:omega-6 fatty acid desaturase (delta-12 desaturase)